MEPQIPAEIPDLHLNGSKVVGLKFWFLLGPSQTQMYTKFAEEHKLQARMLAKAEALELKRDLERERLTALGRWVM